VVTNVAGVDSRDGLIYLVQYKGTISLSFGPTQPTVILFQMIVLVQEMIQLAQPPPG
jgi:hypothetical protein